ncbi:4'-phosphopantetheinyl transferase superfamily protein (plasmid) [Bacillus cereus]|uniref:4'-phosphopantetheinyl transferase family protein n=1 Tax=Bacillus cereus TaxID=1396 RepID=UPI003DA8299B
MNIYKVHVPESIEYDHMQKLIRLVSNEKQMKIQKYKRKPDQYRALIADILIRYLITKRFSKKNKDIKYKYNEHGKPYVDDLNNFHFNISHSESWVVGVFHEEEVGIDVEKIGPLDTTMFKNIFTEEEFDYLNSLNLEQQLDVFYELWTIKESFVKWMGKGLTIPLNSFVINKNKIFYGDMLSKEVYFKKFTIGNDYKLSCCNSSDSFPESIIDIDFIDLCNYFIENKNFYLD